VIDAQLSAQLRSRKIRGTDPKEIARTEIIGRNGMMRFSRSDSACRFACRFLGAAGAALFGLAISAHTTSAEDLTPARIKAATSAVDSAMIEANTATSQDRKSVV